MTATAAISSMQLMVRAAADAVHRVFGQESPALDEGTFARIASMVSPSFQIDNSFCSAGRFRKASGRPPDP